MTMRMAVLASLLLVAASIIILPSGRASAHEFRAVGNYGFDVGFSEEPALAYQLNALFVSVSFFPDGAPMEEAEDGSSEEEGQPVRGLEEILKAEVIVGGDAQKMELTLEPVFGQDGAYVGHFIPTLVGDYTFRIFGDVEGQSIDESFSSGPETFSSVDDPAELQFPGKLPSNAELQASLDDISAQISGEGGSDDFDTALIVAIAGVAVGVLGVGLAGYAISRRPR